MSSNTQGIIARSNHSMRVGLVMLSLLVSQAAFSGDVPEVETAQKLLARCTTLIDGTMRESDQASYCLGFIDGVAQMLYWNAADETYVGKQKACPGTISPKQQVQAVVEFVHKNPALLDKSQFVATMVSLTQSYPCPRK